MIITTSGWIFDSYPLNDKMILWLKNNNTITRLERPWTPSIYVASNKQSLDKLSSNPKLLPYIKEIKWASKFEKINDFQKSQVLQLQLKNSFDGVTVANKIQWLDIFGKYRLYNVDVPAEQSYFYENDIFPLGRYKISNNKWQTLDKITSSDYKIPFFTKVSVKVTPKNEQKLSKFSDKIKSIKINDTIIESHSEATTILDFVQILNDVDPDIILTENGNSFDFPYLVYRAEINKISHKLILGREPNEAILRLKPGGNSYFSYGQMYYKPLGAKLQGRIHIDKSNCFMWADQHSLHGLYEIARTCMLPLQTAARASIGKCMSSVQFYNATKRDLLIPWKPIMSELFKTRMSLLVGDRGGLILEPKIGVFENVAELDYTSLFGNIMLKKNISAETINCKCCFDSKNKVPELNYHICNRQGIVPQSLQLLLDKRKAYDLLIKSTTNKSKFAIYTARKSALKWILVTSFGYLGFNNAKFGRIDAHMAVCAFARKLLMQAIRIAEENNFKVLHGIVDSLWIFKKDASKADYENLQKQLEQKTGFEMSLDHYNWIVFLPSKENRIIPVQNRYFGALRNGQLKIRGIETRRHDTPEFFKKCQLEILNLFALCKTVNEVKDKISEAKLIQKRYDDRLSRHEISLTELAITNRVSKNADQFENNTVQADAVNQLKQEGYSVLAGQKIHYIINDYTRRISKRVVPLEILNPNSNYDKNRYKKLLGQCCQTVIEPFVN